MANNRIFWAVQAVGLSPKDSTSFVVAHGVQSVGTTTNFNLEEAFEVGQIEIYENIENIPDVEVTLEKVIDGYPLLYHLATRGAPSNTLSGRQNQRCNLALNIYGDTQDSASGTPVSELICSGLYVSSLSYNFPVDGNCTEQITLVGNDREWRTSGYLMTGTLFNNTDQPLAYTSGWGGIQRRENVVFDVTNLSNPDGTLLPAGSLGGIPGISSSGTNNKTNGVLGAHVQSISVSVDLGREPLYELGRRTPYHRFANFPTEVTCDIEVYCLEGDKVDAREDGMDGEGNNLSNKTIFIKLEDGTAINLGTRNKLQSVNYGGADAGGGNAVCTYSYRTFNTMTVTHPMDPG